MRTLLSKIHWHWYALTIACVFVSAGYSGVLHDAFDGAIGRVAHSLPWHFDLPSIALDMCLYLLVAGALQSAIFVFVAAALIPIAFTRGWRSYVVGVDRWLEFNVALLLWGSVGNVVWASLTRGKMFVAGDPVVEWFAFLPYSSSIYDYDWGPFHGYLMGGATDGELATIWGVIAVVVWLLSWATVRVAQSNNRLAPGAAV